MPGWDKRTFQFENVHTFSRNTVVQWNGKVESVTYMNYLYWGAVYKTALHVVENPISSIDIRTGRAGPELNKKGAVLMFPKREHARALKCLDESCNCSPQENLKWDKYTISMERAFLCSANSVSDFGYVMCTSKRLRYGVWGGPPGKRWT